MNRFVLSGILAVTLLGTSGLVSAETEHAGHTGQTSSMEPGASMVPHSLQMPDMKEMMQHHQENMMNQMNMANWKDIQLVINNKPVQSDVSALWNTDENMALVPLRAVAEQIGAKISWVGKTKRVMIDKEGLSVLSMKMEDMKMNDMKMNGMKMNDMMMKMTGGVEIEINGVKADIPFHMIRDRIMVPAFVVSQVFHMENRMEPSTDIITFTAKQNASAVYFTANEGGSISKVDAITNQPVNTIMLNGVVHNVQVSPDGKTLGAVLIPEMANHEKETAADSSMKMTGFALFYDTSNLQLIKKVEVGNHPAHIVFTQDGKYVLVTNNEDNTVSVIDARTYQIVKTISTGNGPHGFRISKDSQYAYIANMGEDTVSVINLSNLKEERKIQVGDTPVTTGITSDGKTLVVTLNKENALAIIDLATNKVDKVPVGVGPAQVYIDPYNKYAFVANQGTKDNPSHSVSKVDLQSKTLAATIQTGNGSHGIVTSNDGKFIYVTNMFDNTVSVIDNETDKVVSTVPVGTTPNGISYMAN